MSTRTTWGTGGVATRSAWSCAVGGRERVDFPDFSSPHGVTDDGASRRAKETGRNGARSVEKRRDNVNPTSHATRSAPRAVPAGPRAPSLHTRGTFPAPFSTASIQAARPARPPPITTTVSLISEQSVWHAAQLASAFSRICAMRHSPPPLPPAFLPIFARFFQDEMIARSAKAMWAKGIVLNRALSTSLRKPVSISPAALRPGRSPRFCTAEQAIDQGTIRRAARNAIRSSQNRCENPIGNRPKPDFPASALPPPPAL